MSQNNRSADPNEGRADSLTVTADRPSKSEGRGTGPEGKGESGDNHHSSSVNQLDLSKTPERMAVMSYAALPMTVYPVNGVLGFTVNWGTIDSALMQGFNVLSKAAPYAGGLVAGVLVGALYPSNTIMSEAEEQAMLEKTRAFRVVDKTQPYQVTSLPVKAVTSVPANDIPKNAQVSVTVLAEPVISLENKKRESAFTQQKEPSLVSVVKANPTNKPNVYTAQIVPHMKPMQIRVESPKATSKKTVKVNSAPQLESYIPVRSTSLATHHAIVHFDGKHEPIYVSVSRKIFPEQEKKQVEEILCRDKEYLATHPVAAAERKLVEAEKELIKAIGHVNDKEQQLNKLKNEPLGLSLLNPVAHPLKVDWYEIYELPDLGNRNRIKFDFFAIIETKERLNLLLDKGAEALFTEETDWKEVLTKYSVDKVPQDYIDSPTELILSLGEFYQGTAIEQLTLVREQLLKQQTKIKAVEEALVIAMESRKKAEEKKKAAEDKVEDIEKKLGAYGEVNAKGKSSGREFNKDKAGGPIKDLDWKDVKIDRDGVDKVKLHTGRFGESADNKEMIDRLEKILRGEIKATDIDKRFYTHEIRELERYRNLGIKDGEVPNNIDEVWNNTHTATLEDYNINERTQPLYTPEAIEAYDKSQEIR
ncbi:colicin-like bacteriocin tRNase domain-containing protein [Proteus genomosp. 6]|uniref:Colicin-like bacteriocin tRNase domain-containing protein n=1 Tax=Proteus genomosp. 6 TaxID=1311820 RepID=A0ABV1LAN7_9GAMM